MTNDNYTLTLSYDEIQAMVGWAGTAGVGFVYGGTADPKDPSIVALAKLNKAVGNAE